MSSSVTMVTDSGTFGGYLAAPSTANGAGIVVIQEIFGINRFVRAVADRYASLGYFALAPDLFWRFEPGIELDDRVEAERNRAFGLFPKFNVDLGVKDIEAAIGHLRGTENCGKVGAVGYCLGGLLAYLTAARTDVDASVGYYGVSIDERLGEAANIRKPLLLHIAENDRFVSPAAQKRMTDGLKANPLVTLHSYPGMNHGFARLGGESFDAANADLANERTADFFRRHLR